MDKKYEDRLRKLCDKINKGQHGGANNDAVSCLGLGMDKREIKVFSSGCRSLDKALGGGWPRGRIVEIFGPESVGKTTLCYHAIATFQKTYPEEIVAYIDAEFAFDIGYAKDLGVNTDCLLVVQPESGDHALNVLDELIENGAKCIVIDSVPALVPKAELDGEIGDQYMGLQARLMSQACRMLVSKLGTQDAIVFFVNQEREKIGVTYGDKTTTPGGRALKFYSSVRVKLVKIASNKEGEDVVSVRVKADIKKNKVAAPFKTAEYVITFGKGIDEIEGMVEMGIDQGVIEKAGRWFTFDGNRYGSRSDLKQALIKDENLRNKVDDLLSKSTGKKVEIKEEEEGESKE